VNCWLCETATLDRRGVTVTTIGELDRMLMVAGADFLVGSATDVAVTVTVFPLGTLLGAV
jgi:hypothetical protein